MYGCESASTPVFQRHSYTLQCFLIAVTLLLSELQLSRVRYSTPVFNMLHIFHLQVNNMLPTYCDHMTLSNYLPSCQSVINFFPLRIIRFMVRHVKYFLGLRFEVSGWEHLQTEGPYVIISNHQSSLDVLGRCCAGSLTARGQKSGLLCPHIIPMFVNAIAQV